MCVCLCHLCPQVVARMHAVSRDPVQNFPLAALSLNYTRHALNVRPHTRMHALCDVQHGEHAPRYVTNCRVFALDLIILVVWHRHCGMAG